MEKKKKKFLHLAISDEQDELLKSRAKELGVNVSTYIRMLFMKDKKDKTLG